MKLMIVPLMVLLVACESPAPQMFGAQKHEIVLGGIRFVVFEKAGRAEVLRMGYLRRPERAVVPELMIDAVERATGCRVQRDTVVTGLPGDTGEARMAISC